jgi:hypothetical protein
MEASRTLERISTALVILWIVPGVAILYILGGMILGKPNFHLGLGLINTTGMTGLLFTVVPALLGTAAVLLLFRDRALGARLLTVYCSFWFLNFFGGLIHNWNDIVMSGGIFNGPTGMRIGVGLMIVFFLGSFLLCGIWGWRSSRIPGTK